MERRTMETKKKRNGIVILAPHDYAYKLGYSSYDGRSLLRRPSAHTYRIIFTRRIVRWWYKRIGDAEGEYRDPKALPGCQIICTYSFALFY